MCLPTPPSWPEAWCMTFLTYCCMLFFNILLRILVSVFISHIGLKFSFFVISLFGFGVRMMAGFIKIVWESSIFLNYLE